MRKRGIVFTLIFVTVLLIFFGSINKFSAGEETIFKQASSTTETATVSTPDASEVEYSSLEEAYYSKYTELTEQYGTYELCDFSDAQDRHGDHSYLSGVCVVNLMDFNGDGVEDLFIIYSNGQMEKTDFYSSTANYDVPTQDTYEYEVWTYKDGSLTQILHEDSISLAYSYPNDIHGTFADDYKYYYKNFITVYENGDQFPVIQIYDENESQRFYTNIYYSDGQLVRDELVYSENAFEMNGVEIKENIWSGNVGGYNKILLCSLLADSHYSNASLIEWFNLDYNNTLAQTESVVEYLSSNDKKQNVQKYAIAEGEYISQYLMEMEKSNRIRLGPETVENHAFNLYDIDQDGVPELILYESTTGAGTHYHFYTMKDGEAVNCGEYGRTALYADGGEGLIAYYYRMSNYEAKDLILRGDTMYVGDIAEGGLDAEGGFPELEDLGYAGFERILFCPPAVPMAMYTYNLDLEN